jgi:hypothetical protein
MKMIRTLIAIALAMLALPTLAQVTGTVNAIELNKGSTNYFYRYTVSLVSSGCGSALTSSTTFLWLNHQSSGVEPFAKELHDAMQLAKATGATVQVWFSSDCHVVDVVQL